MSLLGEELKVLVGELQWRQRVEPQVGPALKERGQVCKRVQTQTIIPVVGQMSHEDAYLLREMQNEAENESENKTHDKGEEASLLSGPAQYPWVH